MLIKSYVLTTYTHELSREPCEEKGLLSPCGGDLFPMSRFRKGPLALGQLQLVMMSAVEMVEKMRIGERHGRCCSVQCCVRNPVCGSSSFLRILQTRTHKLLLILTHNTCGGKGRQHSWQPFETARASFGTYLFASCRNDETWNSKISRRQEI